MSQPQPEFDAYHKWLGIPPNEQPPHHYRLLGLAPFEADPDVIDAAADQRMAHLRGRQGGKNSTLTQKLLNEIAAAKLELLDAERKKGYDARLKQALTPKQPPKPIPRAAPLPAAPAAKVAAPLAAPQPASRSAKDTRPLIILGVAVFAVGLLVLVGIAVIIGSQFGGRDKVGEVPPTKQPGAEALPATAKKVEPPTKPNPSQPPPAPTPETTTPVKPPTEASPPAVPVKPVEVPPAVPAPEPTPPPPTVPEPSPKPEPAPPSETTPMAPAKPALPKPPDEAAQKESRALVRDLFKGQLDAARSPYEQQGVARQMLKSGIETRDDVVGGYVLLVAARDVANTSGDANMAFEAIDVLASRFDIDALKWKAEALAAVAKVLKKPDQQKELAGTISNVFNLAMEADRQDVAEDLARLGQTAASKSKDNELRKSAAAALARVTEAKKFQGQVTAAYATLEERADDPDANTIVGRHLCLIKNDWEKGLQHLAKGGDKTLSAAATRDLEALAKPETMAPLTLGDAWRQLAKEKTYTAWGVRAAKWYILALPKATGLDRQKVLLRLDEVAAATAGTSRGRPQLPAHRIVATSLRAKAAPSELAPEAAAFSAPKGDGRVGSNGILVSSPAGWQERGTIWTCTYSRAVTGTGIHFVHPMGNGQVTVGVSETELRVNSRPIWPTDEGPKVQLELSPDFQRLFRLDAEPHRLTSILAADGTFQFYLDDTLVATGKAPVGLPLQLTDGFSGGGLPRRLNPGEAAVIIGPMDNGKNEAQGVAFGVRPR